MPDRGVLSWGHVGLRLPTPCRRALTKAIHTPAFELALKGHVVAAGEDADAVELALHKLPLVPVWEELLRQQLPVASRMPGGAYMGVPRSPGAVGEGEHAAAVEEPILKVPHISGAVGKCQLPNAMPAT